MAHNLEESPKIQQLAQELMQYTGQSFVDTIIKALEKQLQQEKEKDANQADIAGSVTSPRILGLHQGQGWMSEDFTEPLPDEFWLGES